MKFNVLTNFLFYFFCFYQGYYKKIMKIEVNIIRTMAFFISSEYSILGAKKWKQSGFDHVVEARLLKGKIGCC